MIFQMAQFFRRDVEQQVLAARVVFADGLGEIPTRGGQFALRAAELLQHQVGEARIRRGDANGVLQTLVVDEHGVPP